ncbi:Uncharacterized conserved protein YfdQ, DUF2303 family [Kaistia soli DSM 19436]|uniref:Uncharacterized conserved protein YfdQ, DUF2303 family n=1 Tax=Kaistia soli DSM 19436 TaxID=1122133 RepID=A0A1M4Y5N8_9HYPH|nr:DUF2303 family protein [Kaistia soli]SHF01015.1 Uncharacterized conserved protein YfdQ, DUF2303 family [Kaistia soli DSM 19436]
MADKPLLNDIPQAGAAGLIADLARTASTPVLIEIKTDGLGEGLPPIVPALWDHTNQRVIDVQATLNAARQAPARRKGTAKVDTLQSFIDLIERHKDERSAIFAATIGREPKLTAVLDYNTGKAPFWGEHRIVYSFPLTDELKIWIDNNKRAMEQAEFATFLEEHAAELSAPFDAERVEYEQLFRRKIATPSEVLALSRSLEVFVNAKVKQANNLQTGERVLEFADEHVNAKGEPVDIPGIFMIQMRAFVSGDPIRIPVRLNYRLKGGIVWFYELYRWEEWLRVEVRQALKQAGDDTGLPVFEGSPEPQS